MECNKLQVFPTLLHFSHSARDGRIVSGFFVNFFLGVDGSASILRLAAFVALTLIT